MKETEVDKEYLMQRLDEICLLLERIAVATEKRVPKQAKLSGISNGAMQLADLWNEWKMPAFAAIKGLSSNSPRHKNASARWNEKPDPDYWISVIQKVNDSKFCNGDNERGWIADFEFLVRPDNHFRILEGKYDHCHASFKSQPKPKERKLVGWVDGLPVYENK